MKKAVAIGFLIFATGMGAVLADATGTDRRVVSVNGLGRRETSGRNWKTTL
jgi:hypothetical protein